MADLWIFGRKPHGLVRYRHGGFNATFPMNTHTVTAQAVLREADMKREQEDAQAAPGRICSATMSSALPIVVRGRAARLPCAAEKGLAMAPIPIDFPGVKKQGVGQVPQGRKDRVFP